MSDDCVDLMIAAFASLVTDYNVQLFTPQQDKNEDEDDGGDDNKLASSKLRQKMPTRNYELLAY